MASFIAAGTAYSTHGINMIPFFIYYSMFGFQRIGDLIWAACDCRAKGFLLGGTAGRTTLAGEGLQHQDGQSLLNAMRLPHRALVRSGLRLRDGHHRARRHAADVRGGRRRRSITSRSATKTTASRRCPPGSKRESCAAFTRSSSKDAGNENLKVQLFGSGAILREALRAQDILAEKYGVSSNAWSVTSYTELARDAVTVGRWNMLHPTEKPRQSFLERQLAAEQGPFIAASDYVRALAEQVEPVGTRRLVRAGDRRLRPQRSPQGAAPAFRGRRRMHHGGHAVSVGQAEASSKSRGLPRPSAIWASIRKRPTRCSPDIQSLLRIKNSRPAGRTRPDRSDEDVRNGIQRSPRGFHAIEFKVPELGENIESGDIVNVLVKEGDEVQADQPVFEVETGKAVVELPTPQAGKITKMHVQKGAKVKVGDALLTIESGRRVRRARQNRGARESGTPGQNRPDRRRSREGRSSASPPAQGRKACRPSSPRPPSRQPQSRPGRPSPPRRAGRRRIAPQAAAGRSCHAPPGPRAGRRSEPGQRHRRRRPDHRRRHQGRRPRRAAAGARRRLCAATPHFAAARRHRRSRHLGPDSPLADVRRSARRSRSTWPRVVADDPARHQLRRRRHHRAGADPQGRAGRLRRIAASS